jgi:hypothetical protein
MIKIFEKHYDGESLCDLGRDMDEAVSEEYNDKMRQLPVDEHGFPQGIFTVTIEWRS